MDSLEQFARIRAAIERGDDRGRTLRDAGLTPAEWTKLQRRWLDALAAEVESGGDRLATRYLEVFEAARSPAPPPAPPPPEPEPAREEPVLHVPSYLKTAPEPAPLPAPEPRRAPRGLDETAMAVEGPRGPAVPFRPAPTAEPAGTGTAIAPAGPRGPETPFSDLPPEAHGVTLLRFAELSAALDDGTEERARVLSNFGLDEAAHAQVEAHWRGRMAESGGVAMQFGRLFVQAKKALVERRSPRPAGQDAGATVLHVDTRPAAAAPAQPAIPEMRVEQYAWLVATLARVATSDLPAMLARVRLTTESRVELDKRWAARLAADPALMAEFQAALQRHRGAAG